MKPMIPNDKKSTVFRLALVLKQFFNVSYHKLVASLTLMALFKDWFNWHYNKRGGASLHPSIPDWIDIYLFLMVLI